MKVSRAVTEPTPVTTQYAEYGWEDTEPEITVEYLMPRILDLAGALAPGTRVLDVGCGNGGVWGQLLARGCRVVGIDLSEQGVGLARQTYPDGRFEVLAADEHVLA